MLRSTQVLRDSLAVALIGVVSGCAAVSQQSQQAPLEAARDYCLRHEWAPAIAILDAVLKDEPDNIDALRWRGHAFTGTEQHERARIDLARALELGDADAWTVYAHAMALHNLGSFAAALRGYSEAIRIDPDFAKPYEWRGFTLALLGKHIQALPDLTTGMRLDPANTWLRVVYGKTLAALGDYPGAEEELWRAADADPVNADVAAQLGYLLVATGQSPSGRRHLERAIEIDPTAQEEANLWLCQLAQDAGQQEVVHKYLATLRNSKSLWLRAIALYLSGEIAPDVLIQHSAEGSVDDRAQRRCAAWLHIGIVKRRQNDAEGALMAFARAVATDVRDQWEWMWARQRLREAANEI